MKIKKIKQLAANGEEAIYFNSKKNIFMVMGEMHDTESVLVVYKTNDDRNNAVYSGNEEFDDMKGVRKSCIKFGCCDKCNIYVLEGESNITEAFTLIKFKNSPEHYGMLILYFIYDKKSHLAVVPLLNEQDFETMRKYVYKSFGTDEELDAESLKLYNKVINSPSLSRMLPTNEDVKIIFKT